jgi:hypothetical protein
MEEVFSGMMKPYSDVIDNDDALSDEEENGHDDGDLELRRMD